MGLDPRGLTSAFHHVRTQGKSSGYEAEREPLSEQNHAGTLTLDFPATRTLRSKFLLLMRYLICDSL